MIEQVYSLDGQYCGTIMRDELTDAHDELTLILPTAITTHYVVCTVPAARRYLRLLANTERIAR